MPYITLPKGGLDHEHYTAHLVDAEHAQRIIDHHEGHETVTLVPMCMSGTPVSSIEMETWRLIKASGYADDSNMAGWDQAHHVDGLPDLLTRLTVDGLMCENCVLGYEDRVEGLKGLGRRYYDDRHGVEATSDGGGIVPTDCPAPEFCDYPLCECEGV